MVAEGRSVLPSRSALVATLEPVVGLRATALASALWEELCRAPTPVDPDYLKYGDESVELARVWSERLADPRAELPDEVAVRLLVGLTDKLTRDRLLPWRIRELSQVKLGAGVVTLWSELVRRAVLPGLVAPPATLLGWVYYLCRGSGTLANIAVDRALADDPDYVMALHLDTTVQNGVPPRQIRRWLAELGADRAAREETSADAPARGRPAGRVSRPARG
jgi:hypothetical protein